MKKNFKLLLAALTALGLVGAAAACSTAPDLSDNPSASTPAPAVEYTVTFVVDGETLATVTYTEGAESITEPEVPAKEHYTGAWEAYTLDGDVVVNAVYTLKEYKVTFVADGATVATEGYTIENKEITEPEVPAKEGYTGEWATYELTSGDITVEAVYTAIEYEVHFVHPKTGMDLMAPITYTVETIGEIVFPEAPADMAMEGYTVAWDKTAADVTIGGCMVTPVLVAIEYQVRFVHPKTGMDLAAPITYTIENMGEVVFPEVPADLAMPGYTMVWDKTVEDLAIGGMIVNPTPVANTYTITYELNGGSIENGLTSQEVVFDSEYELLVATPSKVYQSFEGWKDAEGNMVDAEGIWTIADDITLTAVYSDSVNFNKATSAPSYLQGSRTQSISLVEMNGGKALQFKSTDDSVSDIAVHIDLAFLDAIFADSSVDYMAFDLKLDADVTTVQADIQFNDYRTTANSWTIYESKNCSAEYNTAPTAVFKTLYLARSVYEAWVTNDVKLPRFLMITKGLFGGQSFYIDNIRPVTEAQKKADWYSFEYGGIRVNGTGSALLYSPELSQWHLNFNNIVASSAKFTHDIVSDGNRAFMFTKNAGDMVINLNHTADTWVENELRNGGYAAYDLYVPEGSDARLGNNPELVSKLSTGWNTIYVKVPALVKNAQGEDDSTCRTISRINDSTGGTYVVDNFRVITADEYHAKTLSFEAGALRDSSLNDGNKAIYYWDATDAINSRFSLAITRDSAVTFSNVHFDTETVKDGEQSLAFHKTNGYISFTLKTDGDMYAQLKDGFTFWIYADLDEQPAINGVGTSNFVNGVNGKFNDGAGLMVKAREWTQVTVTAEEINASGRFLIIQGSTAGTYYIDGFQPLSAVEAE